MHFFRLAEVLYPVPDAYQKSSEQSPTTNVSIDVKPKRRASLIADRITTTEEGKSNWNVSESSTTFYFVLVHPTTAEHHSH